MKGLFDDGVQFQQETQLVSIPELPTYEQSLADILKGKKQLYIDPRYLPEGPELPPGYEEDVEIDCAIDKEDEINVLLADLGLKNYDDVKKQRNRVDITNTRTEKFLNKIIEQATHKRRQLNGVKTQNILLHKKEAMTEQDLIVQNKQVDDRRVPNE